MGDRFRYLLSLVSNLLINSEITHLQVNGIYFKVKRYQQNCTHELPLESKQCNNKIHLIQASYLAACRNEMSR